MARSKVRDGREPLCTMNNNLQDASFIILCSPFRPLQTHFPVGFLEITSGPYSIGDTAIFAIENPYENANAIIMWGSSLGSQHKVRILFKVAKIQCLRYKCFALFYPLTYSSQ